MKEWRLVLVACTLLICMLTTVVVGSDIEHERAVATESARRSAANLAQSLAQQASDTFEATNCALYGLADRIAGGGTQARPDAIADWIAMQSMMTPRLYQIFAIDASGRLRASNYSGLPGPPGQFAASAFFRHHRASRDFDMLVSGPVRGPGDEWLILASRRVEYPDGTFAGVVLARIKVAFFEHVYDSIDVGPRGTVALLANDRTFLALKPFAAIGTRAPRLPGLDESLAANAARTFVTRSPRDGLMRVYAVKPVDHYPFSTIVTLAQDDFLADWWRTARANGIALAALLTLIGLLAASLNHQMSKRERAERELRRFALVDSLTGLANRRQFDAALASEWKRARRLAAPLGLLMIDVDNFKAYNDRYGHLEGDATLSRIAAAIGATVRGGELVARYGGEEFAVILPQTSVTTAFAVAERIRTAVLDLALPHLETTAGVASVSIGVAAILPHLAPRNDPMTLVRDADRALYDSKHAGRNRTSIATTLATTATS